jgi:uncharacterized protein (TIRG00374 family)
LAVWLLVEAEPDQVLASLSRTHPGWIAAAVALVLVDRTLMAYRWLWLLNAIEAGRHLPAWPILRVFFVSTFLGTFLPGSVGGDAVRTVGLSRLRVPPADALASVVVDRLLGVLSLLLMAAGGLFVVRELIGADAMLGLAAVAAVVLGTSLLLLFDSRVLAGFSRAITAGRFPRIERAAARVLGAIRQYGYQRRTLTVVLAASIAVQALRVLQAWSLGRSLEVTAGLAWYFAFVPVIVLIMALPISIGGLGTAQLGFVVFFGMVGVREADAFTLSLLFLGLAAIGNLPGGLLFMFGSGRPAAADPSA